MVNPDFLRLAMEADQIGIKLEMVGGIPSWEAHPAFRHQAAVKRIERSIQFSPDGDSGCKCASYFDLDILFPDGSLKRPDISIFCREPDELDSAVTLMPTAVVEILSKGYEAKDLITGVPFYQKMGIPDIIVFNPWTLEVWHWRNGTLSTGVSPLAIETQSGCQLIV